VKDEAQTLYGITDLLRKKPGEGWPCYIRYVLEVLLIIGFILCLLIGAGAGFGWLMTVIF